MSKYKKIPRIEKDDLNAAIQQCRLCKTAIYKLRTTSIFGIYAGLLEVGKSTALAKGLLVGFDTDWVGLGLIWRDYSPILRLQIPIITNQPAIFIGSGVRIVAIAKK